ncbi:MAG: hypothetical protein ACI8UO_005789 [Verrucomicrobiales bacterium]|jgi:hypothetical protein
MPIKFKIAFALLVVILGSAEAQNPVLTDFFEAHCFDCHSGETTKGDLDLEELSADFSDAEIRRRWVFLHDRVAKGEMPPENKKQPDAESRGRFLDSLGKSLSDAHAASREVVLRRLNRNEYENTVRDLFGVYVDVQRLLPDDSNDNGFDNIGSVLALSPEQLVLYIEAADLVLDQVFGPPQEPERIHKTLNFTKSRRASGADIETEGGVEMFGQRGLPMWDSSVSSVGTYRLRVQMKAVRRDQPVVVRVDGGLTGQIASHVVGFVEVPTELTTIELIDRTRERSDNWSFALEGGFPWWKVPVETYEGPGVFIGDVEIEGPLEKWPPPSRQQLLGEVDPENGTIDDIRAILKTWLPRAFRRATDDGELEPYVALAQLAFDEGAGFENALRRGLKGMLCAPEFLFLEERGTEFVDDFALASRLSYFLWSSMPDGELSVLAGSGELSKPDILLKEVERLLADPKAERFIENFTGQWLRLRDIDFTVPDNRVYPEYSRLLRQSMLDETHSFFREILSQNHSVQNFIDSDFAMLNQPLARFYGIEGVEGLEMRRVELPEESVRGGLLTQASVLKVSADGTRTSPVLRGTWILKNLFGTPSPPPPPSVSAVEPDIRGASTIREQLAKHRNHDSCNRCHKSIDPPGFALESFDVIGAERDWYRTRGEGKPLDRLIHPFGTGRVQYRRGADVDSTGVTADGRAFSGIREYKQLLIENESAMARAIASQLLSYGLGRNLGFSDRAEIERIVANAKSSDYGLRSILHEVVKSEAFRRP